MDIVEEKDVLRVSLSTPLHAKAWFAASSMSTRFAWIDLLFDDADRLRAIEADATLAGP